MNPQSIAGDSDCICQMMKAGQCFSLNASDCSVSQQERSQRWRPAGQQTAQEKVWLYFCLLIDSVWGLIYFYSWKRNWGFICIPQFINVWFRLCCRPLTPSICPLGPVPVATLAVVVNRRIPTGSIVKKETGEQFYRQRLIGKCHR